MKKMIGIIKWKEMLIKDPVVCVGREEVLLALNENI